MAAIRTFDYKINEVTKGNVEATDVKDGLHKAIDKYYEKMQNVEVLDFQFMSIQIQEKK